MWDMAELGAEPGSEGLGAPRTRGRWHRAGWFQVPQASVGGSCARRVGAEQVQGCAWRVGAEQVQGFEERVGASGSHGLVLAWPPRRSVTWAGPLPSLGTVALVWVLGARAVVPGRLAPHLQAP